MHTSHLSFPLARKTIMLTSYLVHALVLGLSAHSVSSEMILADNVNLTNGSYTPLDTPQQVAAYQHLGCYNETVGYLNKFGVPGRRAIGGFRSKTVSSIPAPLRCTPISEVQEMPFDHHFRTTETGLTDYPRSPTPSP